MRRAVLLRVGVGVLLLQGVALLGAAAFLAVRTTGHDVDNRAGAIGGALLTLLGAAAFAGLGFALRLPPRRAAVTPALILEALCLPVAVGLFQGGKPEYGAPVLALALVGLVAVAVGAASVPAAVEQE